MASILRRPLRYSYYNVTVIIVALNLLVFLVAFFPQLRGPIVFSLGLVPDAVFGNGAWWQVLTYMFVQVDFWHLFFNMLTLVMFGIPIERSRGSSEFLLFYLLSGIVAGFATLVINNTIGAGGVPTIGASGAIMAVLLAFAAFFPDDEVAFFGIIRMRAPIMVAVFIGINIIFPLIGIFPRIAYTAHLAGLIFGFLYLLVRYGINPIAVFFRRR